MDDRPVSLVRSAAFYAVAIAVAMSFGVLLVVAHESVVARFGLPLLAVALLFAAPSLVARLLRSAKAFGVETGPEATHAGVQPGKAAERVIKRRPVGSRVRRLLPWLPLALLLAAASTVEDVLDIELFSWSEAAVWAIVIPLIAIYVGIAERRGWLWS